jgi:hypothetical protein
MGWSMSQAGCKFAIKRENHAPALAAIKSFIKRKGGFCWVSDGDADDWTNLAEALEELRWSPDLDGDYNITGVQFSGEKLGDDEAFFKLIAEFVESGSYIEMTGDEGTHWRWVFKDGKCEEINAALPWDDEA